jgi:hypothetical protein
MGRCWVARAPIPPPLAVRRRWARLVNGSDSWWMRNSPPPSPLRATWAALAVQRHSFLRSFLASVAGAAIRARWWASALFGLSSGAALSHCDSALAYRGPRARPRRGRYTAVKI